MTGKIKKFNQIFESLSKKIFKFIYFKLSDYEKAEELTSTVFVKLWQSIEKNTEIENDKALAFKIASNLVIDEYRKKKEKVVNLESVNETLASSEDDFVTKIGSVDELKELYNKINLLSDNYKEIITLHYLNDLSVTEIAEILNKSETNIRVLLHRAIKELKNKYE